LSNGINILTGNDPMARSDKISA